MKIPLITNTVSNLFVCLNLLALPALAHTPAEEMAAAANNLIAALSPEQQAKAIFE